MLHGKRELRLVTNWMKTADQDCNIETLFWFIWVSPMWSQFSSVTQLCPTLCDPMNCSMPGLSVHHQLPEFTQTHVHWVGDAIQSSHPPSSPSLPALNPSQHQGLFKRVSSLHQVAKVLELQPVITKVLKNGGEPDEDVGMMWCERDLACHFGFEDRGRWPWAKKLEKTRK